MSSQRVAVAVMLLLLALLLVSGYWLWGRLKDLEPAPQNPPAPSATPAQTVTPQPTVLKAPVGYRLAGVAVGEPESFAVVEAPSGAHALYRTGEDVPGLGRLLRIEAERVVVQNESGQFDLWLTPAPTATPGRNLSPVGTAAPSRITSPTPGTQSGRSVVGTTPGSMP